MMAPSPMTTSRASRGDGTRRSTGTGSGLYVPASTTLDIPWRHRLRLRCLPGQAPHVGMVSVVASVIDLDDGLKRLGYPDFRPGQREAIETLLARRRLLLVAPTGGGKSLIYQLPATVLGGTTLVISPLIALMQDQCEALAARGVSATY